MTGFEPGISCTEATAIPTVPQPLPYVLLLTVYVEKEAVGRYKKVLLVGLCRVTRCVCASNRVTKWVLS